MKTHAPEKIRITVVLDRPLYVGLQTLKEQTGMPTMEAIRRAVTVFLAEHKITVRQPKDARRTK